MGRCSYSMEEVNKEKHLIVKRRCREMNWEGSDEFCIFHDPSPEKDADLFRKLIEAQIMTEMEKYNFTGYYFPEKWDIFAGEKLEINASFEGATFRDTAYFRGASFQDADFRGASFQDADFRGATFERKFEFVISAIAERMAERMNGVCTK